MNNPQTADEDRIDIIAQNGNDGLHYDAENSYLVKAQSIDFDRLEMLVRERIAALRLYVSNIDKAVENPAIHNAICRDLVFPNIGLLAQFIDAVRIGEKPCEPL